MSERRLPSKKVNAGVVSKEERGPELYQTPSCLTKALLAVEDLPKMLWEPAAGMGHMVTVLRDAGHLVYATDLHSYGCDYVTSGIDFLKTTPYEAGPEAIITNPPFSLANDFVRHGLRHTPVVYILGRLAFLEGSRRSDIIDRHLVRVYPFVERPPTMHRWSLNPETNQYIEWQGKRADSAMPMAWHVFQREKTADTVLRRIRWKPFA